MVSIEIALLHIIIKKKVPEPRREIFSILHDLFLMVIGEFATLGLKLSTINKGSIFEIIRKSIKIRCNCSSVQSSKSGFHRSPLALAHGEVEFSGRWCGGGEKENAYADTRMRLGRTDPVLRGTGG